MKYDRYFLENVHNDIKAYMAAMDLEPHRRPQNLISHFTYGCDFYTLRYWRSADTAWLINNKYVLKLKKHERDIIEKREEYPEFKWIDENGTSAGENLIQWLCESDHETAFRKELTGYNKDEIVKEMQHLKEYLNILL